jgi:hypothetical protein
VSIIRQRLSKHASMVMNADATTKNKQKGFPRF